MRGSCIYLTFIVQYLHRHDPPMYWTRNCRRVIEKDWEENATYWCIEGFRQCRDPINPQYTDAQQQTTQYCFHGDCHSLLSRLKSWDKEFMWWWMGWYHYIIYNHLHAQFMHHYCHTLGGMAGLWTTHPAVYCKFISIGSTVTLRRFPPPLIITVTKLHQN